MKGVLLISHGSKSQETKNEVKALLETLQRNSPIEIFAYAFLEIASPSIPEGIDNCVSQGVTNLLILLNFLNSGRHVNNDIPDIIAQARNKYPHVCFSISIPIGQHPKIADLFNYLLNHA